MVINTTLVGTVPAGSRLVATGSFTSSTSVSLLFQLPSGTFVLWTRQGSQAPAIIPVTLPSGYSVVGSAGDYGGAAGMSQLLLRNTSGNLAYGTYAVNTASFAATSIGNPGANWSVEGNGDYNTFYNGNDQVLLQTVHNGVGTLEAYQSNLPAFTTPAGFTAVPGGTGNFFGTDLPGTLLSNAQGTVEAVLSGGTVNTGGVTTAISQVSVLGTLQGGQTIAAVGPRNSDGSTDILLQNAGTLSEWVVQSGIVQQTMVLGTLPPGASVAGL